MATGRPMRLAGGLEIPAEEIQASFTRTGGPGGQNVNKVESGVLLRFSPAGSRVLSAEQKARLEELLGPRLTRSGELLLRCTEHATRERNLEAGMARLARILNEALRPRTPRRPTRPTHGSRMRRLAAKSHQRSKKQGRRRPEEE